MGRKSTAESWDILLVIGVGGALGSLARYGISVALPHPHGGLAFSTLLINVLGCLLIGVLMATIDAMDEPHRLLRPFLGVGILGGFTTFSTFALDTIDSVSTGRPLTAVLYVAASVVLSLLAVMAGLFGTRAVRR